MGGTIVAMMKYVGHQVRDYLDDYSKVIFFSQDCPDLVDIG